jgi:tripartite-type tricarboxylate transporter receptor subunit TctC
MPDDEEHRRHGSASAVLPNVALVDQNTARARRPHVLSTWIAPPTREETMPARRRSLAAALLCLGAISAVAAAPARAEDYPTRPVRIVTDSAPGSALDAIMRIAADGLSRVWGQQAVIVNQPGAGGSLAARTAAAATPDGYTLAAFAFSAFATLPGSADNLPIQVPRDLVPVGYLGGAPMFLTAAPWLEVKTLPELIALAKQKPGELAYGTNGRGRLTHMTGELLATRAGIKLQMVPYSGGTAQVINDIMGKRIPLLFEAYSGIAGAVKAGNLRPLAVAAPKRVAEFPDLPTVAETLPGFEAGGWLVLVAPPGTPDELVKKANAALVKAVQEPETAKRIAAIGWDERPLTPAETLGFIRGEQEKWAPIVKLIAETH